MATTGYNLEQTGEQVQAALNRIINLSTATEETDGLMSSSDKSSLESLNTEINNKVDKVNGKGLSTNDFTNEEKAKTDSAYQKPSGGIPKTDLASTVQSSLDNADSAAQGVSAINAKIPAQASAQNQLADKAFVNSSVATASADFKGTYDTLQELEAVTADKNDYGYVVSTDSAGNTIYSRYKYTGSAWVFEYDLNNSSFTASEWAAIQSGITSAGVQKLNALPTNFELNTALAGKQATLVSGTNIKTVGGQSLVGSGNVPMDDPNAVKFTAQTLTDAQKAQALSNIGGASASSVSANTSAIAEEAARASAAEQDIMDAVDGTNAETVTVLPTASASTVGKIYYVGPDGNGEYARYRGIESGGSYSFLPIGTTDIDLTNYATEAELSQLEAEVDGVNIEEYTEETLIAGKYYKSNSDPMPSSYSTLAGTNCKCLSVTPGQKYRITGNGGNSYTLLYVTADSSRNKVRTSSQNEAHRDNPITITIESGEAYLYVNLYNYDAQTDKLEKATTTHIEGLVGKVSTLEGQVEQISDYVDDVEKAFYSANNPTADGNYYISYDNGAKTSSSGWTAYKFPVLPGLVIKCKVGINLTTWAAIAYYDANGAYIGGVQGIAGSNDYTATVPANASTAIVSNRTETEANPSVMCYYPDLSPVTERLSPMGGAVEKKFSSIGKAICRTHTSIYSDMTWVGNRLVGFLSSADDYSDTNIFRSYVFGDGIDKPITTYYQGYHSLGHCNTVDYCEENDCLILGNGSGSYTLDGKIIIIQNFSYIAEHANLYTEESPLSISSPGVIVIDCSGYDFGTKFNLIWGENNLAGGSVQYDIAYLITAKKGATSSSPDGGDNGTIRRIQLGRGTNQLQYGQFISGKSDTEFNGTFKVLATYTQTGTNYTDGCNQGTCYHKGQILSAVNHDGLHIWSMRLTDGKIYRDEYEQKTYNADGTEANHNISGICIKDEYLYIGASNYGILCIRNN